MEITISEPGTLFLRASLTEDHEETYVEDMTDAQIKQVITFLQKRIKLND